MTDVYVVFKVEVDATDPQNAYDEVDRMISTLDMPEFTLELIEPVPPGCRLTTRIVGRMSITSQETTQ